MPEPSDKKFLHPRGKLALILAAMGFRIFPLIPNKKTPAIERWPALATTDSETIEKWWTAKDYNIGIATGPAPVPRITNGQHQLKVPIVVDYDMKPGQLGETALNAHKLLGYSDTRTAKTPNGTHKYYWADANLLIKNSVSRIAPNVDVRGAGGYVVAPGSIVDGVEYRWLDDETDEIQPFPDDFASLAAKPNNPKSQHEQVPVGEPDRPHALALAKAYLINDAPEAIQGSHGNTTTYQVAARCKDFGLSEAVTLDYMLNHWNDVKAIPPWAFDALRTIVSNAYQYGRSPPGVADYLNEFDVANSEADHPKRQTGDPYGPNPHKANGENSGKNSGSTMKDESYDDAADTALDNQSNPLIEGLLGQGEISAVYGNPESGKTFAVLDMCHAIASGAPSWNGRKVTQGGVLYVAAEGGPTIRKRFRALRTHYGTRNIPLRLLRYAIDMRTGAGDANRLCQLIKDREREMGVKILLVVIDTLSEALAGGNDTEHMNQFIHHAKIVKNATGANVLVIHHPGKDQSKGPRGSSAFRGWVDTLIEVHDAHGGRKNSRRRFSVLRLRDAELPPEPLWFRLEVVKLGTTPDGIEITSAVTVWADADAADEFGLEMTPADRALFETIGRWSKAVGEERGTVTAKPLLDWLREHERDNPILLGKVGTLRVQLMRLRNEGLLDEAE